MAALAFTIYPPHALRADVEGVRKVKSSGGVEEYRLESNDLTILLAPQREAAATTFSVTYRVGSRDESYGTTGATHLLEHLMFKGTAAHNKQAGNGLDQMLEGIGAETNATTGLDGTTYITTLSPEHLPVIIGLEADRMRGLRLREEDFHPEMTVVWDEYDRGEDDPATALDREIWATAFQAHPYRHSVIGWRSDIENVPLRKLRGFYDTYYWPDHATVAITGAIADTDAALSEIKRCYGVIPRAPQPVPEVYTTEPQQTGPRRVVMKRRGDAEAVAIAFKAPPAAHEDFPVLRVLCDLLADGQNSRFHTGLTDTGLTQDVTATVEATRDPSLLVISAEPAGGSTHAEVEKALKKVLGDVTGKGVGEEEVKTSVTRLRALDAQARDGSGALAEVLTKSVASGDWTLYQKHAAALSAVTAAKVGEVARRWLVENASTTGWYVSDPGAPVPHRSAAPAKSRVASAEGPPPILPDLPPADPAALKIAPRITRTRTAGIDLLVCPGGSPGIIYLSGSIPAGTAADQPVASLVTDLIQRGTRDHSATEIGRLLDEQGVTLEFQTENGHVHFTGSCLSPGLPRMLSVLAGMLRHPALREDEVESVRSQAISDARLGRGDPHMLSAVAFNRAIYPAGHPSRLPDADETIARLRSVRRKDLVAFHKEWFGPAGAILVLAGDTGPALCQSEVGRCFAGWTGGRKSPDPVPAPAPPEPSSIAITVEGRESSIVLLGCPCDVRLPEKDALAMLLATAALGDGFTSRLLGTVRDTEGLTYDIFSALSIPDGRSGVWSISASFAPELLDRGIASTRREIGRWHRDGLTVREFSYRRNAMLGAHRVQLATTPAIADALHTCVLQGLPPDWLDESPLRLQSLTCDDVNAAIRRHLDPERMIEVKCGAVEKKPSRPESH